MDDEMSDAGFRSAKSFVLGLLGFLWVVQRSRIRFGPGGQARLIDTQQLRLDEAPERLQATLHQEGPVRANKEGGQPVFQSQGDVDAQELGCSTVPMWVSR